MKKDTNIRIDDWTYQVLKCIKKHSGRPIKRILRDLVNEMNSEKKK